MMLEDEEPKDWEIREEQPPEKLRQKWDAEEHRGSEPVACFSCKQMTPSHNTTCIFCGAVLRPKRTSGGFLSWINHFLRGF